MGTAGIIREDRQQLVLKEEPIVHPATQLHPEAVIPVEVAIIQLPAAVPLVEAAAVRSPEAEAPIREAAAAAALAEVAAEVAAGAKT